MERIITSTTARLLLVFGLVALAGCATPPPDDDPEGKAEFEQVNDPLEPANRWVFGFNDIADTYLLRPAAEGYRAVTPEFGRQRVSDFLDNLKTPIYLMNDMLQGNVTLAGSTMERFLLNSSFGVLGLMDVATPFGIPGHSSDFGQTLGSWGIDEGPYLVLPLFGPSNPRDAVGLAVDSYADPVDYYLQNNHMHWVSWTRLGASALSQREAYLDALDDAKRTSLDFYSTMRSLYRQRRKAQIDQAGAAP
ncbi:VacJ family lipoprotein [Telmatospirillum siberiense]|uniref:MlaA family lipoprotein n=1 Tax=Telmatospirillum siberiense TaxID=382514 RepID=UPI001F53732B|nr:VacJ family lipoprotein [Telmatospirillum siberiense]